MQGARHVETDLVQKMLRTQQYEQHLKNLGQITSGKNKRYAFKDLPVLSKTKQIKIQSSRFQKSEQRKRIDEQNQFLTNHIIEIQDGKNSQFRSIWTVSQNRNKSLANTTIVQEQNIGKRLHSPLRRKIQQQIDEENQQMMQRLDKIQKIILEKQQDQIQKYQKLKNHMTRIKGGKANITTQAMQKSISQQIKGKNFSETGMKMGDILTKSDINISKISKIE